VEVAHDWQPGDELQVSFGMSVTVERAPDNPRVAAFTYGPVVLAALTGDTTRMPTIDASSIQPVSTSPLEFEAVASFGTAGDYRLMPLIPVSDVVHQQYTTYWHVQ
jgi:hypothetical protein